MKRHPLPIGFTLIELLVVMAIIATLLTIAIPKYFNHIDKAKEAVLRENLTTLRDSLDKFHSDTGKYPVSLDELVARKYLRKVPTDPITDSADTWIIVPPADAQKGGIYDIHSGSQDKSKDGTAYSEW